MTTAGTGPRPAAEQVATAIDASLREHADSTRATNERRYLKSTLTHYGVPVPAVRRVAKRALRDLPDIGHTELWELVHALWRVPVHERRLCAIVALGERSTLLGPDDMRALEGLLRECRTWALLDTLATSAVSDLVAASLSAAHELDRWAVDRDFWIRRAALLALVPELRRGRGDWERFARYAEMMLAEREFFIRKAIGWGLREAGRHDPERVLAWLLPRRTVASGVTMREACKPLTDAQRQRLQA